MTIQNDGEALKRVRWVFVAAGTIVVGAAVWVAVWLLSGHFRHIENLEYELAAVRQQTEALQASVRVDQQYLVVVDVLVAKGSAYLSPQQIPKIATMVVELATLYRDDGLTSSLILAVMERESGFRPDAVSGRGAVGIMQVIHETAEPHLQALGETWSVELMQDPELSIGVGVMELMRLHRIYMDEGLERRDEWHLTLTSYFWGPTNTRRLLESKGRKIKVPSLEYSVGVRELQNKLKLMGVL